MATRDDLDEFVREAPNRGVSRDDIRTALLGAGWAEARVAVALAGLGDVDFPVAVPRPRPSLSAREAFEYLLLFGTLYVSAFALGRLLFQFTDLAFPDPLWPQFRVEAITGAIRWSIAVLVVSAPIFLFMAASNTRRNGLEPILRASAVRRWLTCLTLAIAACVLIGDSTSMVYNLLSGDLTTRFVLKVTTTGIIAGTAFAHYQSDLRRDEKEMRT